MKVIAIVSGGLDSVTLAYLLKSNGHELNLLSFLYGQRHSKELGYARLCATRLGVRYDEVDISSVGALLSSALTNERTPIPNGHYANESMRATIVPNRNAIMLSIATGVAVSRGFDAVAIAVHSGDHPVYPDCRPEFIEEFEWMIQVANDNDNLKVIAPFLGITKSNIVQFGAEVRVPFSDTWSCYKGGDVHCGTCGTCVERREAFQLAGMDDPTEYMELAATSSIKN